MYILSERVPPCARLVCAPRDPAHSRPFARPRALVACMQRRRRRHRRRQKCIALLHQTVLNRTDFSPLSFSLSPRCCSASVSLRDARAIEGPRKSHRSLIRLIGETVSRIDYPKGNRSPPRFPRNPANPRGKYLRCADDVAMIKLIGAQHETGEEREKRGPGGGGRGRWGKPV